MNPRLLLLAALILGHAGRASADIMWTAPAWTVTPTLIGVDPPFATGSASSTSVTGDYLNCFLQAFAENTPGPGGPGVTARIQFSRSFRVLNAGELVALEAPMSGTLSVGPAGGSSGASLTVQYDVVGTGISIFRNFSAPATISQWPIDGEFLAAGEYMIQGTIELQAFAFSGGPTASGDVVVGIAVYPPPLPVPEPGSVLLVAGAAIAALRVARSRRGKRAAVGNGT